MDPNNTTPTMPQLPDVAPEAPVVAPGQSAAQFSSDMVQQTSDTEVPPVFDPSTINSATTATSDAAAEAPVGGPAPLGSPAADAAVDPVAAAQADLVAAANMPTFDPTTMNFGATDPITMPEGPKAPDPVEEELKMPLKAAGPVPGSIGSAVSMPSDEQGGGKVVEHTAPGEQAAGQNAAADGSSDAKVVKKPFKKMDQKTMLIMGAVGAVLIVALLVVLVIQMSS